MQFPRLAIPLSTVLTGLFNLGLNLIAVFAFIADLRRRATRGRGRCCR